MINSGFGVLLINYRGSTGMGGKNIEYILGRIGESDVLDCMTAINTALIKYTWLDPRRITLYGGSHKFINAHLSYQYPEMFKSVVMRNPVIDLASLFSTSDIPDWYSCYEIICTSVLGNAAMGTLPETIHAFNYSESLIKMLNHSPILHVDKVKAATLIALGSNAPRVPPSQGKLWYYCLSSNNVPLYMYDDDHLLSKDEVEIDLFINTVLWILKYGG
ncbi:hypothetical protein TSAR_011951 [Trichomalopsis sarcophagae]|uniref:Peptidase S9 prolyl oligopeptidase catalytic domain-containing protein n=1 Tax=Trichomalopsis sarcophagae TaxID=543379 RepID=A0A232F797_9HYME|nr:hypothetical protein TSAR_011951 [Trichomalopsis sarcophagae]